MSPSNKDLAKELTREIGNAMVDLRGQIDRAVDPSIFRDVTGEITRLIAESQRREKGASGPPPEEFTVIAIPDGGLAERISRIGRDYLLEYLRAEAGEPTQHFIFGPGGEVRVRADFSVEFPDGEIAYLAPPQDASVLPDGVIPGHPSLGKVRSIASDSGPAAEQVGGEKAEPDHPVPDATSK